MLQKCFLAIVFYKWDGETQHERTADRSLCNPPGINITESQHTHLSVTSLENCCLKSFSREDMERKNIITYNLKIILFSVMHRFIFIVSCFPILNITHVYFGKCTRCQKNNLLQFYYPQKMCMSWLHL